MTTGTRIVTELGIDTLHIENAWATCKGEFIKLRIDPEKIEEVEEYLIDHKSKWDVNDITKSICSQMLEATKEIINEEYPDIEVKIFGLTGIWSNADGIAFSIKDAETFKTIAEHFGELQIAINQLEEIINAGFEKEFASVLENGSLTVYDNVEELGADNRDNGCREEDDTDKSFGQFLIQSFKDGNSNGMFYFEFSDGQVAVGNIE